MPAPSTPKTAGLYWASFEDEYGEVLEVALLHLKYLSGMTAFEDEGGVADFVDLSGRSFDWRPGQELVQPSHMRATGSGPWPEFHAQVRITWHGPARPPRAVPKVGDKMPEGRPEPRPERLGYGS